MVENRENPASICNQCVEDLFNADLLRLKCLRADGYFRSVIPKEFLNHALDVQAQKSSSEDPTAQHLWNYHIKSIVKEEIPEEMLAVETVLVEGTDNFKVEIELNVFDENDDQEVTAKSSEAKLNVMTATGVKKEFAVNSQSVRKESELSEKKLVLELTKPRKKRNAKW